MSCRVKEKQVSSANDDTCRVQIFGIVSLRKIMVDRNDDAVDEGSGSGGGSAGGSASKKRLNREMRSLVGGDLAQVVSEIYVDHAPVAAGKQR